MEALLEAPKAESEQEIPIRIAVEGDYDELLRISKILHEENGQHPLSMIKLWELLTRGICRDNAIIGVIGGTNDIKAMIYLSIEPSYYSDSLQIVELFNFVRPDSRKSDYAKRMIRFAKKCSDESKLPLIIGVISDERLEAKARLYARELPKGGVFFVYPGNKTGAA